MSPPSPAAPFPYLSELDPRTRRQQSRAEIRDEEAPPEQVEEHRTHRDLIAHLPDSGQQRGPLAEHLYRTIGNLWAVHGGCR
ncbi:hypothetical protein ACGH2B_01955 [Streptomyces sp. BBFR2]|uniref:hypothetical protein n=1 Tax=Streptomyces sp. BBFR2 TaxID=3372854 RepID=UPI0037DA3154